MTAPLGIKPIRTNEDYEAALDELDRLWDTEPGTPEHDQLEVLATVIGGYENRRRRRYELERPGGGTRRGVTGPRPGAGTA